MNMTELLTTCVKRKASDLHLSPNQPPIMRFDGELMPMGDSKPLSANEVAALIQSILTPDEQKTLAENLEIDCAIEGPAGARFRVNAFHQFAGIAAVFRVIPDVIPTLEQLNLPPVFKELLNLPHGLILLTGPTGSGKSTTLAAMINYLNQNEACHIITIEDPIEFTHRSQKCLINQRQVGRDTKDFNNALRSALREDPDVILVGEMRDLETMRLALTAAETGHLVFATLHTGSAARAVSRIVDVFPAGEKGVIRNILSESLQAVICQTLLKKMNGGRVAAFEIMLGTSAIRNLIREDKIAQLYTTIQTSSEVGMCTLDQYLQTLVTKGLISHDVARTVAINKSSFDPRKP